MSMTAEECLAQPRPARAAPQIPSNVLSQLDMSGKVCVVTGASRGIGAGITEGFAEAGADVVMVSTRQTPEVLEIASSMSKQHGTKVIHRQCDVTSASDVQAIVKYAQETFGRIDLFVANAGVCNPGSIFDQSLEDYHAQMNVNVHGVFYCAKYVGLVFKDQGFGNFIITSSVSGRVVTVPLDHTVYNASKAAATQLGKSLAREWRDFARVNIVLPGWIETDMSNDEASTNEANRMAVLGRLGNVKELKAMYVYLASDASSFVTGAEFTIDGGYTLP